MIGHAPAKPIRIPKERKPLRRSKVTRSVRKGKQPRKQRKTTLAGLKRKLWDRCRQMTRDTWGPTCFTCGAAGLEGGNWQAAHFVNAGKSLAVRYCLENLRPGCYRCNISLRGNLAEYAVRLLDQIGEAKFRRLIRWSRVKVQLRAPEVRELIAAADRGVADYELHWEQTFGPRLDALAGAA